MSELLHKRHDTIYYDFCQRQYYLEIINSINKIIFIGMYSTDRYYIPLSQKTIFSKAWKLYCSVYLEPN